MLITAAAGGTGQIAVQWAKKRGCYVIGTTSSEEKAQFVKDLGADEVINYKKENLDQVLKEKFPVSFATFVSRHGSVNPTYCFSLELT